MKTCSWGRPRTGWWKTGSEFRKWQVGRHRNRRGALIYGSLERRESTCTNLVSICLCLDSLRCLKKIYFCFSRSLEKKWRGAKLWKSYKGRSALVVRCWRITSFGKILRLYAVIDQRYVCALFFAWTSFAVRSLKVEKRDKKRIMYEKTKFFVVVFVRNTSMLNGNEICVSKSWKKIGKCVFERRNLCKRHLWGETNLFN